MLSHLLHQSCTVFRPMGNASYERTVLSPVRIETTVQKDEASGADTGIAVLYFFPAAAGRDFAFQTGDLICPGVCEAGAPGKSAFRVSRVRLFSTLSDMAHYRVTAEGGGNDAGKL